MSNNVTNNCTNGLFHCKECEFVTNNYTNGLFHCKECEFVSDLQGGLGVH
jgi:hypothetical protein